MSDLPDEELQELISSFALLTGDAVSIGYRADEDYEARMMWVNQAQLDMFGYSSEETLGQYVSFFLDPDHRADLIAQVAPRITAGDRFVQGETYALTKTGERLWISLLVVITPTKNGRYSTAICRDLTDLKNRELAAEKALRLNKKLLRTARADRVRFVSAIDTIGDQLIIWDKNQRLVRCNKRFEEDILGRPGIPGESYRSILETVVDRGLTEIEGPTDTWIEERVERMKSGAPFPESQSINGRVFRISQSLAPNGDRVFVRTDVTEYLKQQEQLEQKNMELERARHEAEARALRDDLTGIGNRRLVTEAMDKLGAWRKASGGHITALHIDLDRFKQINDTMGHRIGDAILIEVARRLSEIIGEDDTLARIGGDEFLILRPEANGEKTVEDLTSRILETTRIPICVDDKEVRIIVSIGIASTEVSPEVDLLTDSDIALHKAKSSGRGRICRFERVDFVAMEETKRVSDEILLGLERREFEPYFQMQVRPNGEIVGFEALARWHHPSRGVLAPYAFLEVAEDLDVLDRIDSMIFDKALSYFGSETFASPPSLSFNVSNRRLFSTALKGAARAAKEYQGTVAFELLESILLDEVDEAAAIQLDMLREAGIRIEIDDFGSGHASIIALDQVAPDAIKIDGRLVMAMAHSKRSKRMVRSIIELAHALEFSVTAEGVETAELAQTLKDFGADKLQGYHFGRPVPFEEVLPLLSARDTRAAR